MLITANHSWELMKQLDKISKNREYFNNIINQIDLANVNRTLYQQLLNIPSFQKDLCTK